MIATGPKETVIVVHGSFDAPVGDNKKWFELSEADSDNPNFTTLLDQALIRRGTVARCWAHCERGDQIFSWSGANSWVDRAIASQKLRDLVLTLVEDGWVCHLVGHSHGGNIIADAIPEIIERVDITRSRVITLGTPFINIFESIEQAKKRLSLLYSLSAAAAVIFLLLLLKWLDSDVCPRGVNIFYFVCQLEHYDIIVLFYWTTDFVQFSGFASFCYTYHTSPDKAQDVLCCAECVGD